MAPENTAQIVGSTLLPTTTVTPKVSTNLVDTSEINLSGVIVDSVTHSLDVPDKTKKLVSAYALESSLDDINRNVDDLHTEFDNIYFSPVLTDPLLDPFFNDVNWEMYGFTRDISSAIFTRQSVSVGSIRVKTDAFLKSGIHFVYFEIAELNSGKIVVRNQSGEILKECLLPGAYAIEVNIAQPTIDYIEFFAEDLTVNDTCRILSIYVHWVKTAFSRYMDYMAGKLLSGGSGFASEDYVNTVCATTLQTANDYTNSIRDLMNAALASHISSAVNPHNVTFSQVGAAAAIHSHTPVSLNAADRVHTHTPSECGAAASIHTHTPTECGAAPASHLHTPISISAADRVHSHVPEDCGAAPTVHAHTIDQITDMYTIQNQIDTLDQRVDSIDVSGDLSGHLSNIDNPHMVNSDQVGLGDVINAPMATDQEAIDGVLIDRYMNPRTSHVVLSDIVNRPNFEVSKLTPVPIKTVVWANENTEVSIPIYTDRLYKLGVKCNDFTSLKNLRIGLDSMTNPVIRNNILMAKTLTIGGEPVSLVGWDQTIDSYFKLMIDTLGINQAQGELTLNTKSFTLTGTMHGYVIDPGTGYEVQDKSFPFTISSGYKALDTPTTVNTLILSPLNGANLSMEIVIYEMIQPTQEPALVIDATPVGSVVTRFGTTPVPGWVRIDGSELSRAMYPELWSYAQVAGLVTPNGDWLNEVSTNGQTKYFSDGDGSSTFRIPKDALGYPSLNEYRFIKAKYLQIPEGNDILYRYIWES